MIHNKKEFTGGLVLLAIFFAVLVGMFLPLFDGHNAMAYLDNLYNSISKGSAYYVEEIREMVEPTEGKTIKVSITLDTEVMASESADLIKTAGGTAVADGKKLSIEGNYAAMLKSCLDDSDKMYHNDGAALLQKYPMFASKDERTILYDWNRTLNFVDRALKQQSEFELAKIAFEMNSKVVETAYNYYKVKPEKIMDKLGVVVFSLAFYVIYTMWYGFAILFVFEGWGLKISGH